MIYPNDYDVWNLSVLWMPSDHTSPTNVTISWNNTDLATEYNSMWLHDIELGCYVNLLTATNYTYTAAMLVHSFKVICSKRTHVTDLSMGWNFVSLPFNHSIAKTSLHPEKLRFFI